jgi:hypothetical protein
MPRPKPGKAQDVANSAEGRCDSLPHFERS